MVKRQGEGIIAGTFRLQTANIVSPYGLMVILVLLSACNRIETPAAPRLPPVVTVTALDSVVPPADTPSPAPTRNPSPTLPPTVIPVQSRACEQTGGVVETHIIDSQFLPRALQFSLYLPPCYDPPSDQVYPVLYLLHGQSDTQEQWLRIGLVQAADKLISSGQIPPLVIVMPYEQYSLRNPFESGFEAAIPDELLPWMEEHYPVCAQRTCRAIGGISRGGAWALHLGFTRWELFSVIGAHSAPLFFGSDQRLPGWLEVIPSADLPHLALDVGDRDHLYPSIEELHGLLTSLDVAHAWQVNPGQHDDEYWSGQIENYLLWYSVRFYNPNF